MKLTTPLFGLAAVFGFASAHMEMTSPAPLRSKSNPNTNNVDYDMVNPLSADGSNFPCKGYLNLLGTDAGKAVATWNAGSPLSFTIAGGAHHNGGSCQASISLDSGRTFKVIKSFLGGCPTPGTSNWDFVLPADVPSTDGAIFAWTWFNRVGNREMYMNCAVVDIKGGGGGSPSVPFSQRPAMFVANVNNGCGTLEGSDVRFPNPGPDVSTIGNTFAAPVGNCGSTVSYPEQPEQPEQPNPQLPTTTALAIPADPTPTTLPGGIFIPVTTLTTTTAAPPAETTTTRPADPPVNPPVNPPVTPPVTPPVIGVEDIGPQVEWSRCTQEGVFNCVGGTRFQRCGSGLWSPFLQTAPGTRCKPGVSNEYTVIVVRKRQTIRYRRANKI